MTADRPVRVLDLGLVDPIRSQTVYHAVARAAGPETPDTIILVGSDRPYVCVGYHQHAAVEVDLDRCRERGIPVTRREVGGGAVLLDADQVFVQWVFHPRSLPAGLEAQFDRFARPLVAAYRSLGIEAYLRPINDIHVDGRKIGGTGAAQIGDARVLVGSLMFDFDRRLMADVLRVPSEKMRDKVVESLEAYMTTMAEQLGSRPDRNAVVGRYLEAVAAELGREVGSGVLSADEEAIAEALDAEFASDDWVHRPMPVRAPGVKIHEDVRVAEAAHKAPGGLIRATVRFRSGTVDAVSLSGDFTILPAEALGDLERALEGSSQADVERLARGVLERPGVEAPGLEAGDVAAAIAAAASTG